MTHMQLKNGPTHLGHAHADSDISGSHNNGHVPTMPQYDNTPTHMTQIPITNLQTSPRNSRSSFTNPASDFNKSIRSLQSFKDLFVDRKRISMGHIIQEGETYLHEMERETCTQ